MRHNFTTQKEIKIDLTSIVKLVVDKITPADRFQVLALLKNIKQYLETYDLSTAALYDDPLVSVNTLIYSIEDINIAKQTVKSLQGLPKPKISKNLPVSSKDVAPSQKTLFSSPVNKSTPASSNPPVSRRAGVKRPPPPDSDEDYDDDDDDDDDDDVHEQSEQSDKDDGNDCYSDMSEQVEEVVIQDDGTEWQPIDMLEKALTAIAKEQTKTSYVFDGNAAAESSVETKKNKASSNKKNRPNFPKLYLPDEVEFANPTPRMVSKEGDRKWPENAKWICVYCRLITRSLKSYKCHLQIRHKEDPCCCKYCKREFMNAEMCKFHWCSKSHRCNVCQATFARPYRLRKHMTIHFKSYMVSVTCKLCEATFASTTACAVHVYDEHEMLIMCDSCMTEFDPSESAATSPSRIFCKACAEKVPNDEPEAIPGNVNTEIIIKTMKLHMFGEKAAAHTSGKLDQSAAQRQVVHCDICDEDVIGKNMMKRHLATLRHNNAAKRKLGDTCPKFPCDECGKIFINKESLTKHARVHAPDHNSSTYKCKICDKELMTIGGYRSHMISHINARNFACTECSSAFNKSSHLEDHMDTYHRPDKWFPCLLCDEKFKNRKIRLKHVSLVHENFVYVCPHCEGYEARTGEQLRCHFSSRHSDKTWTKPVDYRRVSDKPYDPTQTPRDKKPKGPRSNQPKKVARGMDDDKSYQCDVCNITIASYGSVKKHLQSVNHVRRLALSKGEEPTEYPCDDCPKKFISMASLDKHIMRNHAEDAPRYECEHSGCDRIFLTPSGLKEHQFIHNGTRTFKCDVCDSSFFHKKTLDDHKACKHGNKTFPCFRCEMKFPNRKLRTKHMDRVHHNYIYYCTECDYETRDGHCLRGHFESRHPTETFTQRIDYRTVADKPYEPRESMLAFIDAAVDTIKKNQQDADTFKENNEGCKEIEASEDNEDDDRSDFLANSIFDDEANSRNPAQVRKKIEEKSITADDKSSSVVVATPKSR